MEHIKLYEEFCAESVSSTINESMRIYTGNRISDDLSLFLNNTVIPASRNAVKNERDAAGLLIDILKHRYSF